MNIFRRKSLVLAVESGLKNIGTTIGRADAVTINNPEKKNALSSALDSLANLPRLPPKTFGDKRGTFADTENRFTVSREDLVSDGKTNIQSDHAVLLNDLCEMQNSIAYAVRRGVLAEAERVIVLLEAEVKSLRKIMQATKLNAEDIRSLKNMVGANENPKNRGYRNYHYTTIGSEGEDTMRKLEALGMVELSDQRERYLIFKATEFGCQVAGLTTTETKKCLNPS